MTNVTAKVIVESRWQPTAKSKRIWLRNLLQETRGPYILPPGVVTPFCTQKSGAFSLFPLLGFRLPLLPPAILCTTSTLLQPKVLAAISYFLVHLTYLVHCRLNWLKPCRLTFTQVFFSASFNPHTFIFSPLSLTINQYSSQSLPFHSNYATHSQFSKYHLHTEDKGRVKPKAPTLSIKCRLCWSRLTLNENSPLRKQIWVHTGRASTRQQLLRTPAQTSTTFSSETFLILEAVSIQSQINYNTEFFQNTRKGLASTWIQSLQFLLCLLRKQHLSVLRIREMQHKSQVTAGIFVFSTSKGIFQFKKIEKLN